MFKGDTALEEIDFPLLTAIYGGSGYNFMTNVSLSAAYLPKLIRGMPQEFAYCVNLKETDFSSLSAVENSMFKDCICLKKIRLPSVKRIGSSAFYRCRNLKTIDLSELREVPVLDNVNAFSGLPADYEILVGRIFPEMVSAAKWSQIASHLKQI